MYFFWKTVSFIFFKVFFRLKAYGLDQIPKEGAFLLAANHVSNFDPFAIGCVCPRELSYLAKEELFKTWLGSKFFHSVGAIPLKRKVASVFAIKTALKALKSGRPLLIFPQGSRSSTFDRAFPGVGYLAKKALVPIIIAKVAGTEKALAKGKKIPHFVPIQVTFKRLPKDMYDKKYEDISRGVLEVIKNI